MEDRGGRGEVAGARSHSEHFGINRGSASSDHCRRRPIAHPRAWRRVGTSQSCLDFLRCALAPRSDTPSSPPTPRLCRSPASSRPSPPVSRRSRLRYCQMLPPTSLSWTCATLDAPPEHGAARACRPDVAVIDCDYGCTSPCSPEQGRSLSKSIFVYTPSAVREAHTHIGVHWYVVSAAPEPRFPPCSGPRRCSLLSRTHHPYAFAISSSSSHQLPRTTLTDRYYDICPVSAGHPIP